MLSLTTFVFLLALDEASIVYGVYRGVSAAAVAAAGTFEVEGAEEMRYINRATYDAVDQSGRILIKMCPESKT